MLCTDFGFRLKSRQRGRSFKTQVLWLCRLAVAGSRDWCRGMQIGFPTVVGSSFRGAESDRCRSPRATAIPNDLEICENRILSMPYEVRWRAVEDKSANTYVIEVAM